MTTAHLGALRPDRRNARRHNERNIGMIERSLQTDGFGRSILLDAAGNILAGNGVTEAAEHIGLEDVVVVPSDGTKVIAVQRTDIEPGSERAHRLAIADNRTSDLSEFDPAVVAALSAEIDLSDFWREAELDALLASMATEPDEPVADPGADFDNADALTEKWGVQPGDLWIAGDHRIICADCTDEDAIARLLDGAIPDMVFADPPYGISIVAANGYVGGGEAYNIPFGGVKNRFGSVGASKPFGSRRDDVRGSIGGANVIPAGKYLPVTNDDTTDTAIAGYGLYASLFPKAAQVWWGGNYYANELPPSSCWLVWDKENTGNFADCELAWTNMPTAVRIFRHQWNGMLRDSERERRFHPTQKPAALAAWCFDKYTEPGALILDPFCGGGMSLAGAEQSGRRAYGIEVQTHYIAVVLDRMQKMGLTPRRVN
jgi:hypothetical protein